MRMVPTAGGGGAPGVGRLERCRRPDVCGGPMLQGPLQAGRPRAQQLRDGGRIAALGDAHLPVPAAGHGRERQLGPAGSARAERPVRFGALPAGLVQRQLGALRRVRARQAQSARECWRGTPACAPGHTVPRRLRSSRQLWRWCPGGRSSPGPPTTAGGPRYCWWTTAPRLVSCWTHAPEVRPRLGRWGQGANSTATSIAGCSAACSPAARRRRP